MFTKKILLYLLIIVLVFACNQKPTEPTPVVTEIAGMVTDKDNGNAISGAQVTTSPSTSSVFTDESGNYAISNLSSGQYIVTASKTGYNQSSISVSVTEGNTTPGDIHLGAIKAVLSASVPTIDFGTSQTNTSFILSDSTGVGSITWTATSSVNWLSISPSNGTLSTSASTITVIANRTGLAFGNYTAAINITSNAGNIIIPATLSVINPNAPQLTVSPSLLQFGNSITTMVVNVQNTGTGTLNWSATPLQNWISLSTSSASITTGLTPINVTVARSSLSAGSYSGQITFSSNGGSQTVNVTMNIPTVPVLSESPSSLDFDSTKTQLSFSIGNTGSGSLTWSDSSNQSWMTISPSSGTNAGTVNVTVNRSGLSPGNYSGIVSLASNGGNIAVNVTMRVASPLLSVSPSSLNFDSTKTQLSFSISNTGSGSLTWSASSNQSWMTISPSSGTNTGTVNVNVSRSGLSPGNYSGLVALTSNGGNTNVNVTMRVAPTYPPQAVTAQAGTITANSIQIQWSVYPASDFAAYEIYYSTSPAVTQNSTLAATITNRSTQSYTITGLSSNTPYYVVVFVLSSNTLSSGSNTVSATTGTTPGIWSVMATLAPNGEITGISYVSDNDIWVCGTDGYHSRVWNYNGSTWNIVPIDSTEGEYTGISFISSNTGWVTAEGGNKIFKYNGISWVLDYNLSTYVNSYADIVAIDQNDVWGSGYTGMNFWNGSTWSLTNLSATYIDDICYISKTEVFAIDCYSKIFLYNGVGWSLFGQPTLYTSNKTGLSAINSSDIWVVANNAGTFHFNGTSWQQVLY